MAGVSSTKHLIAISSQLTASIHAKYPGATQVCQAMRGSQTGRRGIAIWVPTRTQQVLLAACPHPWLSLFFSERPQQNAISNNIQNTVAGQTHKVCVFKRDAIIFKAGLPGTARIADNRSLGQCPSPYVMPCVARCTSFGHNPNIYQLPRVIGTGGRNPDKHHMSTARCTGNWAAHFRSHVGSSHFGSNRFGSRFKPNRLQPNRVSKVWIPRVIGVGQAMDLSQLPPDTPIAFVPENPKQSGSQT